MHNFFYVKRRRKQETRGKRLNEKSTITDPKPTKKAEDHANLHLKKAGFFFFASFFFLSWVHRHIIHAIFHFFFMDSSLLTNLLVFNNTIQRGDKPHHAIS